MEKKRDRVLILPLLKKEQKKAGYVSEKALKKISDETKTPISILYGVATFYSMLYTKPQGKNVIHVCTSPSCYVNGSTDVLKILKKELKLNPGKTTKDKKFTLYTTSCIGCCDEAPAMLVNGKVYGNLEEKKIKSIIKKHK
jgi:NADH:ubiquinone oxidoreductase subunit E